MITFRFRMLPAADGDCMLLSWGDGGPLHHMVVDGGRASAYPFLHAELKTIADAGEKLDLYVLTHIDADHIEGALSYLKDGDRPIVPADVWYNGYQQMKRTGRRSMKQGDDYAEALETLGWPLNRQFAEGVASTDTAPVDLQVAGLKVTMLSPDTAHLKALGDKWETWRAQQQAALKETKVREGMRGAKQNRNPIPDPLVLEGLVADGETDTELPNGSSIAFVAEWHGRRILMGGDAHPDALVSSLSLLAEGGRYRIDVLKASHHGSAKNTSRRLIELIDCRRIAISTNGNLHGHPDPQSLARFIHFGAGPKQLYFNYETDRTRPWDEGAAQKKYGYLAHYPMETPGAIEIDIMQDG